MLRRIETAIYPRLVKRPGKSGEAIEARTDDPRAVASVLSSLRARANAIYS